MAHYSLLNHHNIIYHYYNRSYNMMNILDQKTDYHMNLKQTSH